MPAKIEADTLARIERSAEALGLSIDEYLKELLHLSEPRAILGKNVSDIEFERDWQDFADVEMSQSYDGQYSREDIYFDHD